MFSAFLFFFVAFSLSLSLSLYFLYRNLTSTPSTASANSHPKPQRSTPQNDSVKDDEEGPSSITCSLSEILNGINKTAENNAPQLPPSLLLNLSTLFEEVGPDDDFGNQPGSGHGSGSEGLMVKKKRRRGKKKKNKTEMSEEDEQREGAVGSESGRVKPELVCLYPFTSSSSATQRKIKRQYDQLLKCNESKGLTLAQVAEFANCLIDSRNELQQKSEVIKRKFTITKALLLKADRSAMDRLRQQLYKLELEQKRLEEDAFVYNWLQQQLKLSPAYKKALEIGARMKAEADALTEDTHSESGDISFEELLAQEKKDVFWQRKRKT